MPSPFPRFRRRRLRRLTSWLPSLLPVFAVLVAAVAFLMFTVSPAWSVVAKPDSPASTAPDLVWWITVVEIPALASLFWLNWRARRDGEEAREILRRHLENSITDLRENLAAHKLTVAQTYASVAHLKESERRLTGHLVRIEDKLDRTVRPLASLVDEDI